MLLTRIVRPYNHNSPGLRRCYTCKEEKTLQEFYADPSKAGGHDYECKTCKKNRQAKQYTNYSKNPTKHIRRPRLKYRYGLTLEQWDEMFKSQAGCCAICKGQQTDKRKKRLDVDHCHVTGKVRGLLCSSCNLTLGTVEKNKSQLRRLIDYLDRIGTGEKFS